MSKINILCVPADNTGVGHFRFIEPHMEVQKQFDEDFYVDINFEPKWDDEKYLEKFDIIFGNINMMELSTAKVMFPILQAKGKKIILDVDDLWEVPHSNPQYELAKKINHVANIRTYLSLADYVTTTTEYFAKEIRKYNKNVLVFPNALDPTSKKMKVEPEESEFIRLGYLGGASHVQDLNLLKPMANSILTKYPDKVQTVLCGFDSRGKVQDRDAHGNNFERPFRPDELPCYYYEKVLTADYKNISPEYLEYLKKYKDEKIDDKNLPYRRVWQKPISTYCLNYNKFDISLVPLVNNRFNLAKSQLKVIEAGFYKKAVVASDVVPYQIDIKNGENGFLVKEGSNKDWAFYIKKLIDNPELIKEMGEKLYETVKDKYDLRNVSKDRAEWYKTIVK